MNRLRKAILEKRESEITGEDYVSLALDDDDELWFTQTHFAEIQELMKLAAEVKNLKTSQASQPVSDDEEAKSGLSVYAGYIGKIARRKDGFEGTVQNVDDQYLYVHVTKGKDAGTDKRIQLSFVLSKAGVYSFSDK